jgi:2-methylisocitrate lyase-like PEP mutase family enzyme
LIFYPNKNCKKNISWKSLLNKKKPILLPCAHDSLSAKLIELAGFDAYQIGGFALQGSQFAFPDVDIIGFGDTSSIIQNIILSSDLPVLIDAGACSEVNDTKKIVRIIQSYENMGASAIFIEDQKPPIRCGHMGKKEIISEKEMIKKIKSAIYAKNNPDTFIIARTDARGSHDFDEAIRRSEIYLKNGADGIYIEALRTVQELEKAGKIFKGVPLATTILEGGGETPWVNPDEMYQYGFSMILYPTTVIFNVAQAIKECLNNLKTGKEMSKNSMNLNEFEEIVDLSYWKNIEEKF